MRVYPALNRHGNSQKIASKKRPDLDHFAGLLLVGGSCVLQLWKGKRGPSHAYSKTKEKSLKPKPSIAKTKHGTPYSLDLRFRV